MAGIIGGGRRYIFFNSLFKTNPDIASLAKNKFENINNIFNKTNKNDQDTEQKMTFMQQYLSFLQKLAAAERNSEQAFLLEQIKLINEDPEIASSKDGQQLTKIAQQITEGKTLNYLDAINVFNSLRKNNEDYRKALKMSKERIQRINTYFSDPENFKSENKKSKEELDKYYIEKYNQYKKEVRQEVESLFASKDDSMNISKNLSDNFNTQILKTFKIVSKNKDFFKKIESLIDLNTDITALIQNLIVDYVSDQIQNPDLTFFDWIGDDVELQKKIQKAKQETYNRVFNIKQESFEHYADTHTRGIAKKYLESSKEVQDQILKKYGNYAKLKEIIITLDTTSKTFTSDLNKTLKAAYLAYKKEKEQEVEKELLEQKNDNDYNKKYKALLKKKMGKQIFTNLIQDNIKTTSSSASSIAELLADPKFTSQLNLFFKSFTPGQQMNLKNDIVFTSNFSPIDQKYLQTKLAIDFDESRESFMQNFMIDYKIKSSGTTNPLIASEIYSNLITNLGEKYQKALQEAENDQEKKEALEQQLKNTFLGGISVKEYRYYSNDLGFHGGSLGGGGKVINAIPNILKMYELGGITPIDAEIIIDALLNCGDDMIGKSFSPVEKIKEYLIGGAAMLMFDEGFANTEPFLQKMQEIFSNAAPKTVHLYHLNTAYIPASYILQNIYENLIKVVKNINDNLPSERLTDENVKSNLEITNNVTEDTLPEKYRKANNVSNWKKYSQYAQDTVTIDFLFMAGILDIFEKLPEAFNIQ